jgi:hypothetical protein
MNGFVRSEWSEHPAGEERRKREESSLSSFLFLYFM